MKSNTRRVGEMLLRLKTPVEIQDSETYKRLTIRINHQGVSVRDTEAGVNIGTKNQFRVCAGDFILSKIDARQGAFGIVPPEADDGIITGNFWTYRVDNRIVDTEWFLQFTNSEDFLDLCKRSSTGNTHRKYLNEAIFLSHELEIPSIQEQQQSVVACNAGKERVVVIQHEITQQKTLLAKLKQAILQEAIAGKLTSDWRAAHPDVEPASRLLQRIQAEKARLIAAKKFRPEKPLPKITPAEIPFEIPQGWEWCRLGEVVNLKSGNAYSFKETDSQEAVPYIKVGDMNIDGNRLDAVLSSTYFEYAASMESQLITPKSIIFPKRGGAIATNKRCKVLSKPILVDSNTMAMIPSQSLSFDFVFTWFSQIDLAKFGNSSVLPQVNNKDILPLLFPLPPLAEQAAIVARVEALMEHCRTLEAEIAHTRTHAAHLLQAVLKEAFAPATTHG